MAKIKPDDYLDQWGINTKTLEDFTGVSYRTLYNWFNGEKRDLFETVVTGVLCEMLGTTNTELYTRRLKQMEV